MVFNLGHVTYASLFQVFNAHVSLADNSAISETYSVISDLAALTRKFSLLRRFTSEDPASISR